MPLYVYEPTVYTAETPVSECCFFETLQSLSEPAILRCPMCGHSVHRAVTVCGFIRVLDRTKATASSSPRGRLAEGLRERLQGLLGESFQPATGDHDAKDREREKDATASVESASAGGKAAQLVAGHICTAFCRH